MYDKPNTRVYFTAGDTVELKQELPNKPKMMVKSIDKATYKTDTNSLLGITCIWFDTIGGLHSARFSTKDLKHLDND